MVPGSALAYAKFSVTIFPISGKCQPYLEGFEVAPGVKVFTVVNSLVTLDFSWDPKKVALNLRNCSY